MDETLGPLTPTKNRQKGEKALKFHIKIDPNEFIQSRENRKTGREWLCKVKEERKQIKLKSLKEWKFILRYINQPGIVPVRRITSAEVTKKGEKNCNAFQTCMQIKKIVKWPKRGRTKQKKRSIYSNRFVSDNWTVIKCNVKLYYIKG